MMSEAPAASDSPVARAPRAAARRVALVCDWCLPRRGGIEVQLIELAIALKNRGHEVEIITSTPGPEVLQGITVTRLPAVRMPRFNIVISSRPFDALRQRLETGAFDVVHVLSGIIAPLAYGATFIAARAGLPTLVTFHSVYDYLRLPFSMLAALTGASDLPVVWSAVSRRAARDASQSLGVPVSVLPNGIDVEEWRGTAARRTGRELRVVSVLRFHSRKRPRALFEILDDAQRRAGNDTPITLDIVGDGEDRPLVERLARRFEGRVRLHGWLERAKIRELFAQSHAFLMPSRMESFGIAALEAACAGLPVIARVNTGVEDFIRRGENGLLGSSDSELASHLALLASDAALHARIASTNAEFDWPYSWDSVAARVEESYDRAAKL